MGFYPRLAEDFYPVFFILFCQRPFAVVYLPEEEAELGGRAIGVVEAPRVRSLAAGPKSEADYMRDENRCQISGMMHLNPPRAPLTKCHCS